MKPIPLELQNPKNAEVLFFLEPLSCHSDIVEPLRKVLNSFPNCKSFCPDEKKFKYCIWYLNDVVFAFAIGMQFIGFRIPLEEQEIASKFSRKEYQFDDNLWIATDYNHAELDEIAELAYRNVDKA